MPSSQRSAQRKPDASGAGKAKLPFVLVTVLINMAGIGIIAPPSILGS